MYLFYRFHLLGLITLIDLTKNLASLTTSLPTSFTSTGLPPSPRCPPLPPPRACLHHHAAHLLRLHGPASITTLPTSSASTGLPPSPRCPPPPPPRACLHHHAAHLLRLHGPASITTLPTSSASTGLPPSPRCPPLPPPPPRSPLPPRARPLGTQGDLRQRSSPYHTRIDRLRYGAEKAWSASCLDIKHRVFQYFMHVSDPRRDIDIEDLSTRMEAGNILAKITAASLAEDVGAVCWRPNGNGSRRSTSVVC